MNDPLNNLPPFFIGQKVVYITGINMPKGSVWIVKRLAQHDCGCWAVDIGGKKEAQFTYCAKCGEEKSGLFYFSDTRWFEASSFRPLQEQSFPLITYSKVLKEVPVSAN